jgi:hypothetical protein
MMKYLPESPNSDKKGAASSGRSAAGVPLNFETTRDRIKRMYRTEVILPQMSCLLYKGIRVQ